MITINRELQSFRRVQDECWDYGLSLSYSDLPGIRYDAARKELSVGMDSDGDDAFLFLSNLPWDLRRLRSRLPYDDQGEIRDDIYAEMARICREHGKEIIAVWDEYARDIYFCEGAAINWREK